MTSALVLKLTQGFELDPVEREILEDLSTHGRAVRARQLLAREGEAPPHVGLIIEGMALRYKRPENGQRQVVALLLPGDLCDLHQSALGGLDHDICTLTNCTIGEIPRERLTCLAAERPRIGQAFERAEWRDQAILRQWLVNIGTRRAEYRLAHLFCETLVRLQVVGRADGRSYRQPMTQSEIADATGISAVHANRTLRKLRKLRLIRLRSGVLTIPSPPKLERFAGFEAEYLHYDRESTGSEPEDQSP